MIKSVIKLNWGPGYKKTNSMILMSISQMWAVQVILTIAQAWMKVAEWCCEPKSCIQYCFQYFSISNGMFSGIPNKDIHLNLLVTTVHLIFDQRLPELESGDAHVEWPWWYAATNSETIFFYDLLFLLFKWGQINHKRRNNQRNS